MVPYKTPREAGYYADPPVKQGVGTFLFRFAAFAPEVTRELGRGGGSGRVEASAVQLHARFAAGQGVMYLATKSAAQ